MKGMGHTDTLYMYLHEAADAYVKSLTEFTMLIPHQLVWQK